MKLRFGFCIYGLIIFLLPMLINIVYFAKENKIEEVEKEKNNKFIEAIEQASRILYMTAICVLLSRKPISLRSPWLYLGLICLVLYYIVWIRYFIGNMESSLLGASFFFVPLPLAVFPVLYFIFASLWLHNIVAAIVMVIFGAAHIMISYQNLY